VHIYECLCGGVKPRNYQKTGFAAKVLPYKSGGGAEYNAAKALYSGNKGTDKLVRSVHFLAGSGMEAETPLIAFGIRPIK
jgi:hypothetical protein